MAIAYSHIKPQEVVDFYFEDEGEDKEKIIRYKSIAEHVMSAQQDVEEWRSFTAEDCICFPKSLTGSTLLPGVEARLDLFVEEGYLTKSNKLYSVTQKFKHACRKREER